MGVYCCRRCNYDGRDKRSSLDAPHVPCRPPSLLLAYNSNSPVSPPSSTLLTTQGLPTRSAHRRPHTPRTHRPPSPPAPRPGNLSGLIAAADNREEIDAAALATPRRQEQGEHKQEEKCRAGESAEAGDGVEDLVWNVGPYDRDDDD